MDAPQLATSLTQRAYQYLWQGILSGRLQPGAVLSEAALARTLGISRTPVGEAIRQLADEGLLQQIPRFGTVVRSIPPEEVGELGEMQEALECLAADRAASRRPSDVLSRIEQLCDSVDRLFSELGKEDCTALTGAPLRRFLAADLAFHTLVAGAGGNRRLLRVVRDIGTQQMVFWLRVGRHDAEVARRIQQGHRRILAALREGDAEAARRAMAEHLQTGSHRTLQHSRPEGRSEGEDALRGLPRGVLAELEGVELPPDPASSASGSDAAAF